MRKKVLWFLVFLLSACSFLPGNLISSSPGESGNSTSATPAAAALIATPVIVLPSPTVEPTPSQGIPPMERLRRGINFPSRFWYAPETAEEILALVDPAELDWLHQMGFTFVRLPIDLEYLLDKSTPDLLNEEHLAVLDEALRRFQAADLAVVVDIHSTSLADSDAANYSAALEDPEFAELFVRFWGNFAAHLSNTDPEMVILGPMNEPVFENGPQVWLPIQERLIQTIRQAAPLHTIVATGAMWSNIDSLTHLEPLDDPNLVYDFHFYEPFTFTHQGAEWSDAVMWTLHDVPYPSSPEGLAALAEEASDEAVQEMLVWYGEERWDSERIRQAIEPVANWAKQHQVPLLCLEFGVYRKFSPAADRVRWIRDVRTILEDDGIGWAMWEYDEGFGLVYRDEEGIIQLDEPVAYALGLDVSEAP